MRTPNRRAHRGITAAAGVGSLAVAALLLVAGCSGGGAKNAAAEGVSSSEAIATSSAASSNNRADTQAYTSCLSQHGVTLPTFSGRAFPSGSGSRRPRGSFVRPTGSFSRPPGGFGGGFLGSASADPSTRAALQACASLRPQVGLGRNGGPNAISAATFAAFTSCMSDNGVTITSTDPSTALRDLTRADTKTAAALKICQPVLGTAAAGIAAPASAVPTPPG